MPNKIPDAPHYEVIPYSDEPLEFVEGNNTGLAMLATIAPTLDAERPLFALIAGVNSVFISDMMKLKDDKGRVVEIRTGGTDDEARERIANTIRDLGVAANMIENYEEAIKLLHPDTAVEAANSKQARSEARKRTRGFWNAG